MGGWLEKVTTAITAKPLNQLQKNQKKPGLPTKKQLPAELPTATVIYGIGAALLLVNGLYNLAMGRWFLGFLVILTGGCLLGYALHYLKHQD